MLGTRRVEGGDPARPLGFRYDRDGLCDNVTIWVLESGRWRRVRLSRQENTVMGRLLAANEYATGSTSPPSGRFGAPWVRIEAKGYGNYWIDHDRNCVGPFGTEGRLLEGTDKEIEFLCRAAPRASRIGRGSRVDPLSREAQGDRRARRPLPAGRLYGGW